MFNKVLFAIGSVALVVSIIPMMVGFGTSGVVAGSTAAAMQSGIGNVAAGSFFAQATSIGMNYGFVKASVGGAATVLAGLFSPV